MIFEGNKVEVFEFRGEVLFNPYDCGKCLELKDSAVRMAISKMNNNQVKKLTNLDVKDIDIRKLNNAGENFLTESGVYKLIFKSRKESAERFQDWVTDEVLPTIRKHGAYMTDNALEQAIANPDFMIGLLQNLKKEKEEKKRLQEEKCKLEIKIEEDRPKVTFAERVMKSGDNILVRELAKIISDEGFTIGEKRLYTQLRKWGYVCKNSTEPTQRAMNQKYFVVKVGTINTPYGIKEIKTTLVTPKGQVRIVERILEENK